ncbi:MULTISPECIES: glycosyltransferase [unclassified Imperialibacter]|uniref:glycosyltransferase n=1 Tax=unclassified Imperialibacter TaxID=2629706 RepID=UPI0012531270|nr:MULTISPECIES: glycosyltransferase [unclassified Imperialibacter]CAD5259291.1 Glycosyltransferase [Imperialibacter sp. 89]CAD5280120.1 Glycosyltransferase [Imperialibacter sp. 75]VVT31824.1 Glycosyltransferase [Imperialibacter sp. EC-SDR9]
MANKKNKILYISYDGLTDPLGQSQILPYLLELSKLDYRFHILSCEKPQNFKEHKGTIEDIILGTSITWHPQKYHKYPPVLSALLDIFLMKRKTAMLHKRFSFSACWCRSYLPAIVGLFLWRKSGVPFIFDMRGFWADERVEGGSWPQSNFVFRLVYRYFKTTEKQLLKEAAHVVVLTSKAKEILQKGLLHNNPQSESISIIPCCVDTSLFNPAHLGIQERNIARKLLGINSEDKILVYAGSVGTWYMISEMLQYFVGLQKFDASWKFLVLTMDNPQQIVDSAKIKGLSMDDIVIRPCKRAEMPLYLSLGHLAISFIQPVFSKQASSPTKLAEYLAMGLPVAYNANVGDVDDIMDLCQAGIKVEVDPIAAGQPELMFDSNAIREFACNNFTVEKGVKVYSLILKEMC